jgi:hypothetical protein
MILLILTSLFSSVLNMNWTSLMGSRGLAELTQYPDKNVYRAATILTPEERPRRAQVKVIHGNLGTSAIWDKDNQRILVNNRTDDYKNQMRLAALLAHEAIHEDQQKTGSFMEAPAYQRQTQVSDRLGYVDKKFRNALAQQLLRATEEDKSR